LDSVLHVPSSRRSVATPEHPRDRYRTPTPLVPHPRRSATTKLEALDSGKRVQPDDPRGQVRRPIQLRRLRHGIRKPKGCAPPRRPLATD
jgi:hypothetical protein